jgi:hypothetical protein
MNETKQIFNERERDRERDEKFDIIRDDDWNLNYFMFYTTAT